MARGVGLGLIGEEFSGIVDQFHSFQARWWLSEVAVSVIHLVKEVPAEEYCLFLRLVVVGSWWMVIIPSTIGCCVASCMVPWIVITRARVRSEVVVVIVVEVVVGRWSPSVVRRWAASVSVAIHA